MKKTEYVAAVAEASGMTQAQAAIAVDASIAVITKSGKLFIKVCKIPVYWRKVS